MPLYEIVSMTTGIEKLAHTLLLEGKTKVPTKEEGTVLFKYKWTEECANLVKEFSKAKIYTRNTKY